MVEEPRYPGGITAMLAGALGLSDADATQITELITTGLSLVGGVMAVYGRVMQRRESYEQD